MKKILLIVLTASFTNCAVIRPGEAGVKQRFGNFQSGIFIGANVGGARIGPSAGVRYVQNFNAPNSQVQLYGIWKF